jgi:TolA-binding protein
MRPPKNLHRNRAMGSRRKAAGRLWIFLGTILTVLPLVVTACEQKPKTMLAMAEARWKQGDYLGAVQAYEHLVDEYPKSLYADEAYYAIGTLEYLYLNNDPKAVEALQKVGGDHSGSPLILQAERTLAEIYEKKYQDHRRAVAEYQKILEQTPDRTIAEEVQYRVGEVYFDQGDFDQARDEWDQLLKQSPKSEWADKALYRTGNSFFLQGRYSEALGIYQEVVRRYPNSDILIEVRFWKAGSLEELDRLEEALQEYRSLIDRYPNPRVIEVKVRSIENRLKTLTARQPATTGHPSEPE